MVRIDGETLTPLEVEKVAVRFEEVSIDLSCLSRIESSRAFVERVVESGKTVYGINTGFGKLADTTISTEKLKELQRNLVLSHASGTGKPFNESEVRAIILARANSLAKGYSGVRQDIIEKLLELLNKRIYPYVPCFGSLGASGDLAPLAHIAILLIGEGRVFVEGNLEDFNKVKGYLGFEPLQELFPKEGLALINGTSAEVGIASLLYHYAKYLLDISIKASALSIEALRGKSDAFDTELCEVRNFPEGSDVSRRIKSEIAGSSLVGSDNRVQDAYAIRCIPAVYGSAAKVLKFVEEIITAELNGVTDNPVIFPESSKIVSGGNFHGQSIAFAMDFLAIALSEIGNITERRINRLLNPSLSLLPPFLAKDAGVNSGMMILQYTAASLVSMNKVLSHPASVDSIPVSADQEDHVSMGMNAVLKARDVVENLEKIIAIELITASQAVDFLGNDKLGKGSAITYRKIREHVNFVEKDRELSRDIEKVSNLLKSRSL